MRDSDILANVSTVVWRTLRSRTSRPSWFVPSPKLEQRIELLNAATEASRLRLFSARMAAFTMTHEASNEALPLFYKAIELDPNFAAAYGMAARCYSRRKTAGWVTDRAHEIAETARLAQRAANLGRDDAVALSSAGIALAFVVGDLDEGDALIDRALVLNPNLAAAWTFSGWVKVWLGEHEVAIEHTARAMRLSPHDPLTFLMQDATAAAHFLAGRYAERCMGGNVNPGATKLHTSAPVAAASAGSRGTTLRRGKPGASFVSSTPGARFKHQDCSAAGGRFRPVGEGLRKAVFAV